MKEVRHSFESKVNGRRLQNEVRDKGHRRSWFSLIAVLQAGIKDANVVGLKKLAKCG
jgi:hypothetical protein